MKLQSAVQLVELHGRMFDFSIRAFTTDLIRTAALASEERRPERSNMKKEPAGPLDGFTYNQNGSLKGHPNLHKLQKGDFASQSEHVVPSQHSTFPPFISPFPQQYRDESTATLWLIWL